MDILELWENYGQTFLGPGGQFLNILQRMDRTSQQATDIQTPQGALTDAVTRPVTNVVYLAAIGIGGYYLYKHLKRSR
jgi:hypothetical protein